MNKEEIINLLELYRNRYIQARLERVRKQQKDGFKPSDKVVNQILSQKVSVLTKILNEIYGYQKH